MIEQLKPGIRTDFRKGFGLSKELKLLIKKSCLKYFFSQVTFWFHNYLDKSKHKEIHQQNYSVTGNTSRMSSWAQIGKLLI